MNKITLDMQEYTKAAREAAAEGQVLLVNQNDALPLKKGSRVALFGRMQLHYYKSGTGSGGMVNVSHVVDILEALEQSGHVILNQKLLDVYKAWDREHPFNPGIGWGTEPFSQEEMTLSEELVQEVAGESDTAVVILARTAGEDRDNTNEPGAYQLSAKEEAMLQIVRSHFSRMIVLLNVGNIMDMRFVDTYNPDAVLYVWQGGMIGGLGTVDVLTGKVSPSGHLTDTIAYAISDYPSDVNFGNKERNFYAEDIYVGYRYFETAAKDKVRYPFGYGLSYTTFSVTGTGFSAGEKAAELFFTVKNTGKCAGKEVVQVYAEAPQGTLSKPARVLAGFQKTKLLMPGEEQALTITVPYERIASYDETGVTGYASSFVLEKGEYLFHAGANVRDTQEVGSFTLQETVCLEALSQALAPVMPFQRMRFVKGADGTFTKCMEDVPLRQKSPREKRMEHMPETLVQTGDQGYRLQDVQDGRVSMETFLAQLSDEDLCCIIRGEGMGSPKVTAGTAGAFGGVSDSLKHFGIPCGCCSDGPSGMRIDSGMKAFSLPSGMILSCSFNPEIVEKLYAFTGIEMTKNRIDALLGPGMNIHRHPLNGRNFEYYSEDPLVTGIIAGAMIRGLQKSGVTGVAKHFCGNNQEAARSAVDSVISERALREIYLKGFEIIVKEAGADALMTTYGRLNGIWTAGSYELNTQVLRHEWGFDGILMTDWWAQISDEDGTPSKDNFAAMAAAQNDLYMVCQSAVDNQDNTAATLKEGTLTRGELQRIAGNICRFLLKTHAFSRMNGKETMVEVVGAEEGEVDDFVNIPYFKMEGEEVSISLADVDASQGKTYCFALDVPEKGTYEATLTASSMLPELAQISATLIYQSVPWAVYTFNGTGGQDRSITHRLPFSDKYPVMQLYFAQSGLDVKSITFRRVEE